MKTAQQSRLHSHTSSKNAGVHDHELPEVDARIAALEARVSALEGAPEPPPDPDPEEPGLPPRVPSGLINVTTNGRVIENVSIVGQVNAPSGMAIRAVGTITNPIRGLRIRNVHVKGYWTAIYLEHVADVVIEDVHLEDQRYAGILTYSAVDGVIKRATIQRIGDGIQPGGDPANNCYGIALSRYPNVAANPRSARWEVTDCVVEDVPLWHSYDTHAGEDIAFRRCISRRTPRPFFITGDSASTQPRRVTIEDCRIEEAKVSLPSGTNAKAITLVSLQTGTIRNVAVSGTYPTPHVYDYQGGSTNVAVSGMTVIP